MTDILIHRFSTISGATPTVDQIEIGEIQINTKDGKVFFAKSGTTKTVEQLISTNSNNQGDIIVDGDITANNFIGYLSGTSLNADKLDNMDSTDFATVSGNTFNGNQEINGDVNIKNNLILSPTTQIIDENNDGVVIQVKNDTGDLLFTKVRNGVLDTINLKWLEGNLYTGLLSGGVISATNSGTTFNISAGTGLIVTLNADLIDEFDTTIKYVKWEAKTNISLSFLNTKIQTYIAIDSNGDVVQSDIPFYDGQYNDLITLGTVIHQNLTYINSTITYPNTAYGYKQRTYDFIKAFGPLKLNGLSIIPVNTLGLNVGSGTAWADGRNYQNNPNNPSYITDSGTNVSKIFRYYQISGNTFVQDTNNGLGYTTIDPTHYNLNGVLTSVPGTGSNRKWSIQRVFWYPNSATKGIVVYYGNKYYNSSTEAVANSQYEEFYEVDNTKQNAVFLGSIVLRNDALFTDSSSYLILPSGIFRNVGGGSGGGGTIISTRLEDLIDVSITTVNNGDLLTYNNSINKWINGKTLIGDYGVTGNLNVTGNITGIIQYSGITNIPTTIVTGSTQIYLTGTTGFSTYINQPLLTTSNVTFSGITNNGLTYFNNSVGIGTPTPNSSSILDITSTTKGFLPPRMTTLQKNAIASPSIGLTLYDTDNNSLEVYNGSSWGKLNNIWGTITGTLSGQTDLQNALNAKQNQINGLGFVKADGTTISFDNNTYLTTSSASTIYAPIASPSFTGNVYIDPTGSLNVNADASSISYQRFRWFIYNPSGGTIGANSKFVLESTRRAGTTLTSYPLVINRGNVGINITDLDNEPSRTLSVNGDALINTNLSLGFTGNSSSLTLRNNQAGVFTNDFIIQGTSGYTYLGNYQNLSLGIYTNNTERIRILGNGNVGIGTSSPTTLLHVNGAGTFNGDLTISKLDPNLNIINTTTSTTLGIYAGSVAAYNFNNANGHWFGTQGTYRMKIMSSATSVLNNFGIGTETPSFKLDILSTSVDVYERFTGSSSIAGGFLIGLGGINQAVFLNRENTDMEFYTNNTLKAIIKASGNVGIGTTSPISLVDVYGSNGSEIRLSSPTALKYGELVFSSSNTTYKDYGASIEGNGNSVGLNVGQLLFKTGYGTVRTVRMIIDPYGNVGIGTSSPLRKLHITSAEVAVGAYQQILEGTSGGYGAGISFQSLFAGTSTMGEMARITADGETPWNSTVSTQVAGLRFYTTNNGSTTEKLRITGNGNILIGTTTDAGDKLQVNGNINISNSFALRFGGGFQYISNNSTTSTINFGSNGATNMSITNGNVLIGTSIDSGYKLNVSGSINTNSSISRNGESILWGNAGDSYANIRVLQNASTTLQDGMYINYSSTGTSGAHLRFFANGITERMRIDASTGNVGIGTTIPYSKLQITNPGAIGSHLRFDTGANSGYDFNLDSNSYLRLTYILTGSTYKELVTFAYNGNVGIGTSSPVTPLHIYLSATTAQPIARFETVGTNSRPYIDFKAESSDLGYMGWGGTGSGIMYFMNYLNSDVRLGTNSTSRVTINGSGNVGIGTTNPSGKLVISSVTANTLALDIATNNTTSQSFGMRLYAGTNTSDYALRIKNIADTQEYFFVRGDGNVGIGTSSPSQLLTVLNASGTAIPSVGSSGGHLYLTNGSYGLMIGVNTNGNSWLQSSRTDGTATNYTLLLNPNGGNVGIGTTNPLLPLHIVGTGIQFSFNSSNQYNATIKPYWNSATDTRISFGITPSASGTPSETFHIMGNGNVGIGTTNPLSKLDSRGDIHVSDGSGIKTRYRTGGIIDFTNFAESAYANANITANTLTLAGNNGAGIYINNVGNVGIGTTSPTNRLTVSSPSGDYGVYVIGNGTSNNNFGILIDAGLSSSDYTMRVRSKTTSEYFAIRGDGNVGIGTANPTEKLTVYKGNYSALNVLSDTQSSLLLNTTTLNGVNNPNVELYNSYGNVGLVLYPTPSTTYNNIIYYDNTNKETQFQTNGSTKLIIKSNGNVLIGTSTDSGYKLDVTGTFRTTSNSYINGLIKTTKGLISSDNGRILSPPGASYQTTSSVVTGAFKIKLPTAKLNSNTMLRMTVKIYTYNTGKSYTYDIGGYNHTSNNWYNVFAYGMSDNGTLLTVRFGQDATSNCIWIGETGTTWDYPQVFVTDVQLGFIGTDESWLTDWSITPVTSFDTVATTYTPSILLNTKNNPYNVTFNGNVGIGTTTPNSKLEISGGGASATDGAIRLINTAGNQTFAIINGIIGVTNNGFSIRDVTNSADRFVINSIGNVGIGTVSPNAPLQLSNAVQNRKIILYEEVNNDYQFYGFGINSGAQVYYVANTGASHIFRAGSSSTTDVELLRIVGNGRVGIGVSTPLQALHIQGSILSSTGYIMRPDNAGIAVQFSNGTHTSYGNFNFNNIVGNTTLMSILNNGNVLIGTTTDVGNKLYVNGTARFEGAVTLATNVWNTSTDGKNRFYFSNNSTTYFGSSNGYIWRNASDVDIMLLGNSGSLQLIPNGATNDPYGTISVTQPTTSSYSYYGLTRQGNLGMGMGITTSNQFFIGTTTVGGASSVLLASWMLLTGSNVTFNGSVNTSSTNGYQINGNTVLSTSGNYTVLYDSLSNRIAMFIGNTVDPANYYDNNAHSFRSRDGGTSYVLISANGLRLQNYTTTQVNAIASPTGGCLVFDSTTNYVKAYTASGWKSLKTLEIGSTLKTTMLSNSEVTITTSTATSTSYSTFATTSYTPTSSSSYLIIECYFAYTIGGGGSDSYIANIEVDATEIGTTKSTFDSLDRTSKLSPVVGRFTNSSTTAKTINVRLKRNSADDNITILNDNTFWLKITEILR